MAGTGRSVESEGGGASQRGFRFRAGRTARRAFDPMVESVERAGDALAVDLTGGDGVDPLDLAAALAPLGGLPMVAVASHGSGVEPGGDAGTRGRMRPTDGSVNGGELGTRGGQPPGTRDEARTRGVARKITLRRGREERREGGRCREARRGPRGGFANGDDVPLVPLMRKVKENQPDSSARETTEAGRRERVSTLVFAAVRCGGRTRAGTTSCESTRARSVCGGA
jgi:hypothetical protein